MWTQDKPCAANESEVSVLYENSPDFPDEASDGRALALPLVVSLICTGVVVSLFPLPQRGSLNWPQLVALAFLYIGAAASVHSGVVSLVCRAFREHMGYPTWLLTVEIWGCVGWVLLIVLLAKERSPWVCVTVPLTIGSSVGFLKARVKRRDRAKEEALGETRRPEIFSVDEGPSSWQALLPTAAIAVAGQIGMGALLAQRTWVAGILFAIGAAIFVWRSPLKHGDHPHPDQRRILRSSAMLSLFIVTLSGLTLLPFLKKGYRVNGLEDLLKIQRTAIARPETGKHERSAAAGYSGIVLVTLPKPHHEIIPPTNADPLHLAGALTKPVVIPFDGAYWYFQIPDTRPSADARIQRGDPLTTNIRSTNRIPIVMEAHQILTSSINLSCCKALKLNMVNADNHAGRITVEILLRDTAAKPISVVSLGRIVIPSSKTQSISFERPPTYEAMTFHFPSRAHRANFNEITVIVTPDWDRALAGSKVSIQNFVLLP